MPRKRKVFQFDPEAVRKTLELCEGHGILPAQELIDAGLPEDFVQEVTVTHKSGKHFKEVIFVNGQMVKELRGVYDLSLVRRLCAELGVDSDTHFMGRGFECHELKNRIYRHLKEQEEKAA